MACASGCFDEAVQFDMASLGPVDDAEILCRGASGKKAHYNSAGVKTTFIRDRDLLAGTLSVWRRCTGSPEELDDILAQQVPPAGSVLWDLFGATAEAIRSIRAPTKLDVQALHIYDDASIDDAGGKHPNHAIISICSEFSPASLSKDDVVYVEIRDALAREFRRPDPQWALPAEQRV